MIGRKTRLFVDLAFIFSGIWLMKSVSPWFAFLIAGVFLFPLLRDFGVMRDLDERERYIDAISSKAALAVTILIILLQIGLKNILNWDELIAFVLIPIVTKALVFMGMALSRDKTISYSIRVLVLVYLFFVFLSHGFSFEALIEALPGILVLVFGELARKWRWFGLGLFGMVVLITSQFIDDITRPNALLVFYIITAPIVLAGVRSLMRESIPRENS
ncbi:hypothetical protein [Kosmotoga pacifica]|uniref:Uncharacterized protein n=1 Tax=Kosmotoga pacifica TaxID=1330330 RepID=A0A0G2Z689_9BACT|nr:hypothetical protein [Kosmotoga pacifica]AKI97062.1 hypothetical protein IX53_03610 [Kosmotoga pacifica]